MVTSKRLEQINRKTLIQQAIRDGREYKAIAILFRTTQNYIAQVARNMGVFKTPFLRTSSKKMTAEQFITHFRLRVSYWMRAIGYHRCQVASCPIWTKLGATRCNSCNTLHAQANYQKMKATNPNWQAVNRERNRKAWISHKAKRAQ